ncbi:MAG: hypothetical protein NZN45_04550 [Rhodovarius sp.]|nr:hypothetical protein [Rhodovarius sp.]
MADPAPPSADRAALLARLRAVLARTTLPRPDGGGRRIPLDPAIDAALAGGGLAAAALHEIEAAEPGAATAFAALLMGRAHAALGGGALFWIGAEADACPQGLARLGLPVEALVMVQAWRRVDALWAAEECSRCAATAATLLCTTDPGWRPDLTASRRLQLAAETGGGLLLLLYPTGSALAPSAARSRWRVDAAPYENAAAWRVELLHQRGGPPAAWACTWQPGSGRFSAAPAAPGAAELPARRPSPRRLASSG